MNRLARLPYTWAQGLLDLVFPPHCVVCHGEHDLPERPPYFCSPCSEALFSWPHPQCKRCAAPIPEIGTTKKDCIRCRSERYRFDRAIALGVYRNALRDGVLQIKRTNQDALTLALGEKLAQKTFLQLQPNLPDVVAPVPMPLIRRVVRGVNCPEILAEPIARRLQAKLVVDLLTVQRNPLQQSSLPAGERRKNMRGVYRVSTGCILNGAHVLLVDDVLTTGATASDAARAVREGGASRVTVSVVARAIGAD